MAHFILKNHVYLYFYTGFVFKEVNLLSHLQTYYKRFLEKPISRLQYYYSRMCAHPVLIALFLLASALLASFLMLHLTTTERDEITALMQQNMELYLWNILPALLAVALVYFLTGRALFTALFVNVIWCICSIADTMKVSIRQEPLLPTDFTLIKEALSIFKTFPVSTVILIFGLILFCILLLVFVFCFFAAPRPKWHIRLIGVCTCILAGGILNTTVYADTEQYESYPIYGNAFFQVNQYNSRGLAYSFFHQLNAMRLKAPLDYNATTYRSIYTETTPVTSVTDTLPHIIMIMGEAYSDLSENEHISFDGYVDPMENFRALCAQENAVSGHIVVPNYGGGTSNTEYDVLTGLSTRFLASTQPTYSFIHKDIDALPYRLQTIGYDTAAIHPGDAWFYNRNNVYPDLGFAHTYFLEDSFNLQTQGYGGYVNETATIDKVISVLEEQIQTSDTPLFSFTVTIQNHAPYEKKYNDLAQNFVTDVPLSDTESDMLTQYFSGVADADRELGRLVSYAEQSTEPIVLVYFGDHLPGFSNGMDFFDILDYPINLNGSLEEQMAVFETPYVLWANDAAAAQCDFSAQVDAAALPENGQISAFYLGALTTELIGLDGLSPLFDTINTIRKQYPVIADLACVDANGNYLTDLPNTLHEQILFLKGWEYFILFDQVLSPVSTAAIQPEIQSSKNQIHTD